jgi:hypothetical protein
MRFRSSGFGTDKELKGYMSDLSPVGEDLLVFHIQTTEPVEWHLRAGMQFSDIPNILKGMLKSSILFLTLRALFFLKKNPKEPENF